MQKKVHEIDLSPLMIPRLDGGEPDWDAIAARVVAGMEEAAASATRTKIIDNLEVDEERFFGTLKKLYGLSQQGRQAQIPQSPMARVQHVRTGYVTMTGIPIEEIPVALDRPYPKSMYTLVPGRKDMHDISPTATLERINAVFGVLGYGWTVKQSSSPKIEYVPVAGRDGKDDKLSGWIAQMTGEFVYVMISTVEGVENSMSLGVPIFAAYFVPDSQKSMRAQQDVSRGLTTVMYGAIIKAFTNFAHLNPKYEGEGYEYTNSNSAE